MAVPEGWMDVNETLTAPSGNKVVLGFREYILTHDWQADDVPLENEHAVAASEGTGTAQLFACTRLRYTSAHGVYKDDIGRQLQVAQQALAALRAQVVSLQPGALSNAQRAALKSVADAAAQLAAAFGGAAAGGTHAD